LLWQDAVAVEALLDLMQKSSGCDDGLVFLDACRALVASNAKALANPHANQQVCLS